MLNGRNLPISDKNHISEVTELNAFTNLSLVFEHLICFPRSGNRARINVTMAPSKHIDGTKIFFVIWFCFLWVTYEQLLLKLSVSKWCNFRTFHRVCSGVWVLNSHCLVHLSVTCGILLFLIILRLIDQDFSTDIERVIINWLMKS